MSPVERQRNRLFDAVGRQKEMDKWRLETGQYASGQLSAKEFIVKTKADHASDIIESMWGALGKSFYINTFNEGAVTNMAGGALPAYWRKKPVR